MHLGSWTLQAKWKVTWGFHTWYFYTHWMLKGYTNKSISGGQPLQGRLFQTLSFYRNLGFCDKSKYLKNLIQLPNCTVSAESSQGRKLQRQLLTLYKQCNHLPEKPPDLPCLNMPTDKADTISLVAKSAPLIIRHLPLLFIIVHQVLEQL